MPSVLVVDDPVAPLFGDIRSVPTVTVTGPADALLRLARQPFEAVVVAIPSHTERGIAGLLEIAASHPDVLRVVVLGDGANPPAAVARVAHRMFDATETSVAVTDTVEQVSRLRPLVTDPRLATLIGRLTTVPAAPALYQRLLRECRAANPSLRTIATLVAEDPGLAARLLQLANCALYARGTHVVDPAQAVQRIGMQALQGFALSAQVFDQFDQALSRRFNFDGLWRHGLIVNSFAAIVGRIERAPHEVLDVATTGGLLHDIGRVLLAANLPDEYDDVIRLMDGERSLIEAEVKVFGVSHAAVGAYLLALWGLPVDIVDVVAKSHAPTVPLEPTFDAATALVAADRVAAEVLGCQREDDDTLPSFTEGPFTARWTVWRDACLAWARPAAQGE
jgi:putative nucleotidyltransferase with HDIG domain